MRMVLRTFSKHFDLETMSSEGFVYFLVNNLSSLPNYELYTVIQISVKHYATTILSNYKDLTLYV